MNNLPTRRLTTHDVPVEVGDIVILQRLRGNAVWVAYVREAGTYALIWDGRGLRHLPAAPLCYYSRVGGKRIDHPIDCGEYV